MSESLMTTFCEPVPSHPATIEVGSIGSLKVKTMVSPWSRRLSFWPLVLVACTSTAVGAMLSVIVTVAGVLLRVPSEARVGEGVGADEAAGGGVGEGAVGVEGQGAVGGAGDHDRGQRVAVGVGVVGQHPGRGNSEGAVRWKVVGVVVRDGGVVDRGGDGDGDGGGEVLGRAPSLTV